ncbi:MAG: insulinase family protein [Clostridia bacterium]|nr:insulinase family protein [Clostridia bacterium]
MIDCSYEIAKGVRLNYIKTTKFKTNYISFNFIAPLSSKTAHYNAMLPLILTRASRKYPTQMEISKRLQYLYSADVGASNNSFGEYHIFGLKANMLNNRFANDIDINQETMNLICDLIFDPYLENGVFSKAYVKGEKQNLIDCIEAEINNKSSYATKRMLNEMCKDEVFNVSKLGEVQDVKRITSKSLYGAYKRAIEKYPIVVYVVGDCDIDAFANKLKECFSKIDRSPIEIPLAEIKERADSVKQIVDCERVKQGKLVLGFRTAYKYTENTYHLLQLFNEVYGGSPTSKLFMNVREKMSLCYTCRSAVSQRMGVMMVSSGIEFDKKEIAEKAIIDQLEQIQKGNISKEEFDSAKKSIINGYKSIYDSASAMANWVFYRSLCDSNTTPLAECEKIEATTVEQIQELANRITLDTVYFLKGENTDD